jgi:hypothetical protein
MLQIIDCVCGHWLNPPRIAFFSDTVFTMVGTVPEPLTVEHYVEVNNVSRWYRWYRWSRVYFCDVPVDS